MQAAEVVHGNIVRCNRFCTEASCDARATDEQDEPVAQPGECQAVCIFGLIQFLPLLLEGATLGHRYGHGM